MDREGPLTHHSTTAPAGQQAGRLAQLHEPRSARTSDSAELQRDHAGCEPVEGDEPCCAWCEPAERVATEPTSPEAPGFQGHTPDGSPEFVHAAGQRCIQTNRGVWVREGAGVWLDAVCQLDHTAADEPQLELLRGALNAAGIDALAEVSDTELVERMLDTWQGRALVYGLEAVAGTPEPRTITAEAEATVYGDRQDDYGHPRINLTRTACMWTALLQHKLAEGEHVGPDDVARLQLAGKLSRDVASPKRDNRVDMAGWALNLDRLETGR